MKMFGSLFFCSFVVVWLLPCRNVLACHREEQFFLVEGTLPTINPIKTTTTPALAFCSMECIAFPGCNSYAFLTDAEADNCLLSASADGGSTAAKSVVYKKDLSKTSGCGASPCLNGGTCLDQCNEPFYSCQCPPDKQGQTCEWDLDCFDEDWSVKFDNAGTYECSGTKSYMVGLRRSEGTQLLNIESAKCCPVTIEYSQQGRNCQKGHWWDSFSTAAWNECPAGYFVTGLMRGSGESLEYLEEGVCCKPDNAPATYGDCYYEDISNIFDNPNAAVRCQRPQYYLVALRTSGCRKIFCIEELKCCRIG